MTDAAVASIVSAVAAAQAGADTIEGAEFDIGNLAVTQKLLEEEPGVLEDSPDAILSIASRLTQCLFNRVFQLPSTPLPDGKLVQLPDPVIRLPRGKPIPKPKPLTKWEKFAKEKGIVKKKRSKLAFDEATQDWKRIHGYKKANDALDTPIIEASDKDKDGEDPFTRLEREKSERVSGNKKRNAQNREEALLATNKNSVASVPATVKLSTKLDPASVRGQIAKGKALKKELKQASYFAGVSTASMGKFDKKLKGEKDNERKLPGSRKKVLAVTGGSAEHDAAGKILGKVIRKGEEPLINMQKAIGKHEAKKRRGRGDSDDEEGGEGGSKRKKGRVGRVKNRRVPKKPKQSGLGTQKGKGSVGKKGAKGKGPKPKKG